MKGFFERLGRVKVSVKSCDAAFILDLCLQNGWCYRRFSYREEGEISFWMNAAEGAELKRGAASRGRGVRLSNVRGVPRLFSMLSKHIGLLLGGILIAAMLLSSSLFVWEIRVEGNESKTAASILEALDRAGLRSGSFIPALHADRIETTVLLADASIGWISVNRAGCVVTVQIREAAVPDRETPLSPANVVASADGTVERMQVFRGKSVVHAGEAVRQGDLLISGILDSEVVGFRYSRAAGEVWARVYEDYTVTLPLTYEKSIYTGRESVEVEVIFFSKNFTIFQKTMDFGGFYDIIESEEVFHLGNLGTVPLGVRKVRKLETEKIAASRSPQEALELAYAELADRLRLDLRNATLLSKQISTEIGAESVSLHCRVCVLRNIARQIDFEINFDAP